MIPKHVTTQPVNIKKLFCHAFYFSTAKELKNLNERYKIIKGKMVNNYCRISIY